MYWSGPNRLFSATLAKLRDRLREEHYVGYIDVNCIVNGQGIYPLEFTARFGYPTICIQSDGISMPIGDFLAGMADGTLSEFKTRRGFQIGVRIVVPPFPYHRITSYNVCYTKLLRSAGPRRFRTAP